MINTLKQLDASPRHAEFVYFAVGETTGRVKIGHSRDPRRRIRQLQQGASERLHLVDVLPGSLRLESYLHHHFAEYRVIGEWFEGADLIFEMVERMAYATERIAPELNEFARAMASGIDDGRLPRDYWKLSHEEIERRLLGDPVVDRDLWDPRLN